MDARAHCRPAKEGRVVVTRETWTPLGEHCKYLGKLFIDRRAGERPNR
jgi:hypothetical protein